jgi:hypothetical protein
MKKVLVVAGGVILVVLIVLGCFVGYASYEGSKLDASSKAYVDECVPAIVSAWSKDALLQRSSPELLNILKAKPDETDLLLAKFSKLGALRQYDGAKGDSFVAYNTAGGKTTTANYTATARFENGDAQITIRLIQLDGQWRILLFNVNSSLFLR